MRAVVYQIVFCLQICPWLCGKEVDKKGCWQRIVFWDKWRWKSVMILWILEDAEKQEWSRMTSVLPFELKCLLGSYVVSKGDAHSGELMVFYPWSWL